MPHKEEVLPTLDRDSERPHLQIDDLDREELEEDSRMAAAALPSAAVLERIQRYETKLQRQIFRALARLERMQRQRGGEVLPAPLTVELSEPD